jgi:hypothetical protein
LGALGGGGNDGDAGGKGAAEGAGDVDIEIRFEGSVAGGGADRAGRAA